MQQVPYVLPSFGAGSNISERALQALIEKLQTKNDSLEEQQYKFLEKQSDLEEQIDQLSMKYDAQKKENEKI